MEKKEFIENFIIFLKKRDLSPSTIIAYTTAVKLFYTLYDDMTIDNLQSFRSFLISKYKANTINLRIYAVNCYKKFLDEQLGILNSSYKLTSVKLQRKSFLDNVISEDDFEYFKNCLKKQNIMFWYFVIRFLASTGMRVSELVQIKAEDIGLGFMDLYSKGGKIRRIYFPDILCEEALDWLNMKGIYSGFIFINRTGHPITPRGIRGQLKKLATDFHIDTNNIYPHSFRHWFAKNFLAKFNDIALLADLMGHESIETTRIYLKHSSMEQQQLIDEIVTW